MRFFSFFIVFLIVCGCNVEKKSKKVTDKAVPERAALKPRFANFSGESIIFRKNMYYVS